MWRREVSEHQSRHEISYKGEDEADLGADAKPPVDREELQVQQEDGRFREEQGWSNQHDFGKGNLRINNMLAGSGMPSFTVTVENRTFWYVVVIQQTGVSQVWR